MTDKMDKTEKKIFEPGTKVAVEPGAVSAYNGDPTFGGHEVKVLCYDEDDDTYEVLSLLSEDRHNTDWFNASDILSLEEYRAFQIEKILKFFGGEPHSTNYADLDDRRIMIDGVYDIDGLIKLLKEI